MNNANRKYGLREVILHIAMKMSIISMAIVPAFLCGCATSASSTWVCNNGTCTARGIMITEVDENTTLVTRNPKAEPSSPPQKTKFTKVALIKWKPELNVGIKEMDEVHIKLIHMVNALYDAVGNGTGDKMLGNIFVGLISYVAMHCADQERLMSGHELARQHQENERELNQLLAYKQQFASGKPHVVQEVLDFMKEWVATEINKGYFFKKNETRVGAYRTSLSTGKDSKEEARL